MLGFEARCASRRRKKRKKHEFSPAELEEILKLVLVSGISQRDVADSYNVKPSFICNLVKNEKLEKN